MFSIIFYAWGEPGYIWLILISTFVDYVCGKEIHKNLLKNDRISARYFLLVSILFNIGMLSFFKYSDFIITNINSLMDISIPLPGVALPIGISFYTFQTMSYTIDVYRGEAKVQNNAVSFGAYVSMFPQLIAGPVVRYGTIARELTDRSLSLMDASNGVRRFILGLGKKVLLANNIGLVWESISSTSSGSLTTAGAWLGMLAFGLQIYFDFSAYSDMAIGLGKVLGFSFPENFNYPYMSRSITEFWRRWHISLGVWFREYVYIPMGGNRKGLGRQILNIFTVWILTGVWHGASWNFVLWGIYFGLLLVMEKVWVLRILDRLPKLATRVYTLFLVIVSWVLFSHDSLIEGVYYLRTMFDFSGPLLDGGTIYIFYTNFAIILAAIIGSTHFPKWTWDKIQNSEGLWSIMENVFTMIVLVFSTAFLVDQSYNPFLYFRF
ncbi:MAG: hypothetical protein NUK57_05890 [Gudongella sp.]|nr:hypothetical protein [Gudongella sp.]